MPSGQFYKWSVVIGLPWVDDSHASEFAPVLKGIYSEIAKRFIFQREKATSHHFQGYLQLQQKITVKGLRQLLLGHIIPTIPDLPTDRVMINVSPASVNGEAALKSYVMKRDETYREGPWMDKSSEEDEKDPGNVYDGSDLLQDIELDDWQRDLENDLSMLRANGQIHWFYSTVGGKGKTEFAKRLARKFKTPLLGYGSAGNLANVIFKAKKRGHYIFDLTRAKPTDLGSADLYSVIEGVANGRLLNLKYETGMWENFKAHVVVFANVPPSKGMLSVDRLRVASLDHCPTKRKYNEQAEVHLRGVPFMTLDQLNSVMEDPNPRPKKRQKTLPPSPELNSDGDVLVDLGSVQL